MKASYTLTKPFLVGVLQDICELFPEHDFSYEKALLDSDFLKSEETVIPQLALVGKALEKSLITGCNFRYNWDFLEPSVGAEFPRLFEDLWVQLFHFSGVPHFAIDAYADVLSSEVCSSDGGANLAKLRWGHSTNQVGHIQSQKALCVLLLRQFFLGLSKLTSLECLCLGGIRDSGFQEANYSDFHTVFSRLTRA